MANVLIGVAALLTFIGCAGDGERFEFGAVENPSSSITSISSNHTDNKKPLPKAPIKTPSASEEIAPQDEAKDPAPSVTQITTTSVAETPIAPKPKATPKPTQPFAPTTSDPIVTTAKAPTAKAPTADEPLTDEPTADETSGEDPDTDTTSNFGSPDGNQSFETDTDDTGIAANTDSPTTTTFTATDSTPNLPNTTFAIPTNESLIDEMAANEPTWDVPTATSSLGSPDGSQSFDASNTDIQPLMATPNLMTMLPFYANSGQGDVLISQNGDLMINFDDTGIMTKDLRDANSVWQPFFNFASMEGLTDTGVGSVTQDPASENTFYFCGGNVYGTSDSYVDYKTGMDLAGMFRTTDGFGSAERINSHETMSLTGLPYGIEFNADNDNNMRLQRHIMGCASEPARYIYDQVTGVEGWWEVNRNSRHFAFDPRETVTVDGATLSKTFYFVTYTNGLTECVYSDTGMIECNIVQNAPSFVNDESSVTWFDLVWYQYKPQTNDGATADERSLYDPENGSCDVTMSGVAITGTLDATTGKCVEDEVQYVGSAVTMDPVSIDTSLNAADAPSVLYSGYIKNDLWVHGGAFRGVKQGNGTFEWTEIKPSGSDSLDVRDIVVDDKVKVQLDSGQYVAKYFYVAAGRGGVVKGEVQSDGTVVSTFMNTGLFTRDDMRKDVLNGGTGNAYYCPKTNTTCGMFTNIEMAYKEDGTVALMTMNQRGTIHYAIDDRENPVTWYAIWMTSNGAAPFSNSSRDGALSADQEADWAANNNFGGPLEGGAIDPATGDLIIPGVYIYRADNIDFTSPGHTTKSGVEYYTASAQFHAFNEGFGDYGGRPAYDPYTIDQVGVSTRVHMAKMDGGRYEFSFDADYKLDESMYGYPIDEGFCLTTYTVAKGTDLNSLDANGDSILDKAPTDYIRGIGYGLNIVTVAKKDSPGDWVMYISGTDPNNNTTGAIYRGDYDAALGDFKWSLATGDQNCQAFYAYGNANKNTCTLVCAESEGSSSVPSTALPVGNLTEMTADPNDSEHLIAVLQRKSDSKYALYESGDGGETWMDLSNAYVDEAGNSLSDLGAAVKVYIDPNDSDIFYVLFDDAFYQKPSGEWYFTDIANIQADDNAVSEYLSWAITSSQPDITDVELVNKNGKTHAYLTTNMFCDSGWGVYGTTTACSVIDGGIYGRVLGEDSSWQRLNATGDTSKMAFYDIAVSPANPDHMVAVGYNSQVNWTSSGNPKGASSGIAYTIDGGLTWSAVPGYPFGGAFVSAHPTDPDKFLIKLTATGIYELNLGAVQ